MYFCDKKIVSFIWNRCRKILHPFKQKNLKSMYFLIRYTSILPLVKFENY